MTQNRFTPLERKTIFSLSSIVSVRMIGLFLIVPVLALHAHELTHTTPYLIGLALGIYGLTQALFQVPFGALSDRFGRKPMIALGLIVFAFGCGIAAESTSIYGVIVGRAMQGAGAISAVVLAFVGDAIRPAQRTKSMAIVGVSIGAAFTVSLMLGPLLDSLIGLRGIFWVASAMAVAGLIVLFAVVPRSPSASQNCVSEKFTTALAAALKNRRLLALFSGTLVIHGLLTALFLAYPIRLLDVSDFTRDTTWKAFLPILLLSFAAMLPLLRLSGKRNQARLVMIISASLIFAAQACFYFGSYFSSVELMLMGLWLFFVGFNSLEALFPSTAVSCAPESQRGTTMGLFNTCTFSGAFLGGVAGGIVFTYFRADGVFMFAGIAILLWIAAIAFVKSASGDGAKP